jgi:hypothetical protein
VRTVERCRDDDGEEAGGQRRQDDPLDPVRTPPQLVPAKDKPQEAGEQAIGPARFTSHQDRGVETPAFRPGRKRRVTSPEMSAVSDSVFACPGTA